MNKNSNEFELNVRVFDNLGEAIFSPCWRMRNNKTKHICEPSAIDLFAGAGGLTAGLKAAGFKVIGAVENSPEAVKTYSINNPLTTVIPEDIRQIDTRVLKKRLGLKKNQLHLLAGCPPCQGFSRLKTLNGKRDSDEPINDLIFEFLRFVEALSPHAIMLENVPALAENHRLTRFCESIVNLGYSYEFKLLDVSKYGVPQRRKRMILIASLHGFVDWASEKKPVPTVRDAIGELPKPGASGDPLHDFPEKRSLKVRNLIRKIPKNGGSRLDLGGSEQLACHQKCDGFRDVYGRMSWNLPSPTITGGCTNPSKGRFLHPTQNRAISLREAALLQSFPKDYTFSLDRGKGGAAQMIGNALPPKFVEAHAKKIIEHIVTKVSC